MEETPATPTLEFNWIFKECSLPPDSMYLWNDLYDSINIETATADQSIDSCGYIYEMKDGLKIENCCRSSLNLTASGGYQSLAITFDATKFPVDAANGQYCVLENVTETLGYEKGYFRATGTCLDGQFRCFSGNQSLSVYPEGDCQGNPAAFNLDTSTNPQPVEIGLNTGTGIGSFLTISPSAATIEYIWTTNYPAGLYVPLFTNPIDVFATTTGILSILLPLTFLLW